MSNDLLSQPFQGFGIFTPAQNYLEGALAHRHSSQAISYVCYAILSSLLTTTNTQTVLGHNNTSGKNQTLQPKYNPA